MGTPERGLIVFFLFCGAANLFVAFTFQDYWVDFKVFGSLGMTVLFLIGQGIYLSRHLHDTAATTPKPRTDMLYAIIATDAANSLETPERTPGPCRAPQTAAS